MPVLENVQESPPSTGFNNFVPPVSPIHSSSSSHFDYDYPIQTSLGQQGSRWNNIDGQTLDGFSAQDAGAFTTFNPYASPVDGSFTGFDTGEMGNAISGLSTTPPSSTFATGLPFSGLEFIRNYNPGGYSTGEQDALWHSYDPGAFGFDPELPFTLCDLTTEGQEGTH